MKKGDIVIIFVLAIISISSTAFIFVSNVDVNDKYAVVKVGGEEVKRVSFDKKTDAVYEFYFGREKGYIEIKDGRVRVLEMDKKICPNKVCSLTGWIEKRYQAIVCLPNKITVSIENLDKNQKDIDAISF